jgi:hypothetical protein
MRVGADHYRENKPNEETIGRDRRVPIGQQCWRNSSAIAVIKIDSRLPPPVTVRENPRKGGVGHETYV